MRAVSACCVALAMMFSLPSAAAQSVRLMPVDEAAQDPSFATFRQRLLEALRGKDPAFVIGILDPAVKVSFGGDEGPRDFARHWGLDRPETSRLWTEFSTLLGLGGVWQREGEHVRFCAPYVSAKFPNGYDAFEYSAITGRDVAVRARADARSPVVERLTFDIVRSEYGGPAEAWIKITTPTGRAGYVARQYVRSPIDYRACFTQDAGGSWKLNLLVAGD